MDSSGKRSDTKPKVRKKFKMKATDSGKGMDFSWFFITLIVTFILSAVFNLASSEVMKIVNMWVAILILLVIIFIGIIFDIIGVAVTTAEETPFHSMAVHNVKGARQAIKLIKARDKVSNFCNDVIGDICGIISGSASAAVVTYIVASFQNLNGLIISLIITAFAAAITVGGKALGKGIAMSQSNKIVYFVGRIIAVFDFIKFNKKNASKNKFKHK